MGSLPRSSLMFSNVSGCFPYAHWETFPPDVSRFPSPPPLGGGMEGTSGWSNLMPPSAVAMPPPGEHRGSNPYLDSHQGSD